MDAVASKKKAEKKGRTGSEQRKGPLMIPLTDYNPWVTAIQKIVGNPELAVRCLAEINRSVSAFMTRLKDYPAPDEVLLRLTEQLEDKFAEILPKTTRESRRKLVSLTFNLVYNRVLDIRNDVIDRLTGLREELKEHSDDENLKKKLGEVARQFMYIETLSFLLYDPDRVKVNRLTKRVTILPEYDEEDVGYDPIFNVKHPPVAPPIDINVAGEDTRGWEVVITDKSGMSLRRMKKRWKQFTESGRTPEEYLTYLMDELIDGLVYLNSYAFHESPEEYIEGEHPLYSYLTGEEMVAYTLLGMPMKVAALKILLEYQEYGWGFSQPLLGLYFKDGTREGLRDARKWLIKLTKEVGDVGNAEKFAALMVRRYFKRCIELYVELYKILPPKQRHMDPYHWPRNYSDFIRDGLGKNLIEYRRYLAALDLVTKFYELKWLVRSVVSDVAADRREAGEEVPKIDWKNIDLWPKQLFEFVETFTDEEYKEWLPFVWKMFKAAYRRVYVIDKPWKKKRKVQSSGTEDKREEVRRSLYRVRKPRWVRILEKYTKEFVEQHTPKE